MSANRMQFLSSALYSMICMGATLEGDALKGLHEIVDDMAVEALADRRKQELAYLKAEQQMQEMLQRLVKVGG